MPKLIQENIKVSVALITYNHERFIAQALNSILMQEVEFEYEIVVGEDCSADKTRQIIESYCDTYPDLILLLPNVGNLGPAQNLARTINACKGEYIALLDGDDYWISEKKLAKQVKLLDENRQCVICFHNVQIINETDPSHVNVNQLPEKLREFSNLSNLLLSNYIPTCSVTFRNGLFEEFPAWYFRMPFYDFPLHTLNAMHGEIVHINEVMSVYRVHQSGIWSLISFQKQLLSDLQFYSILKSVLGKEYLPIIHIAEGQRWTGLAQTTLDHVMEEKTLKHALDVYKSEMGLIENSVQPSKSWRRELLARIYAKFTFISYDRMNYRAAGYCWINTISRDISWLKNRGFLSVGLKSLLGHHS